MLPSLWWVFLRLSLHAHVDHDDRAKPVTFQERSDQGVSHLRARKRQIACAQHWRRALQCSARTPLHPRRRPSPKPICAKFATRMLGGRGKLNFGNRSFSQMIYICSTIHLSEIPVPCGVRGREPFRSTDRASEARLVLLGAEHREWRGATPTSRIEDRRVPACAWWSPERSLESVGVAGPSPV